MKAGLTMDTVERIKLLKCMEFIVRHVNNEDISDPEWHTIGVADGDIEYGDLTVKDTDADDLYVYIESDEDFADLMDTFLHIMSVAYKSGGLYCDEVVSCDNWGSDSQ